MDQFDLDRFVRAQDSGDTHTQVLTELRRGRKVSHWMWFVFPQLAGLGRSGIAQLFALSGVAEARAYLAHPVLGARLRECCEVVLGIESSSAERIFGSVDAMKLRSSMTLFNRADPEEPLFTAMLDRFFDGRGDARTHELLD